MGHDKRYGEIKKPLLNRKFYQCLFILLPVFFSIFALGPLLILLGKLNTTGVDTAEHQEEIAAIYNFAVRWTYILLAAAFTAGIIAVYSFIRDPLRRTLPDRKLLQKGIGNVRDFGDEFKKIAGSFRHYFSVLDSMAGGVLTVNRNGDITMASTQACQILGLKQEDLLGTGFTRHFASISHRLKEAFSGEVLSSDLNYSSKEDEKILGYTISPIKGEAGIEGAVFIFKDITEIRKMRNEFIKTEKLASLGALTREVAHEVRNPLASIKGLVQLIGEDIQGEDPRKLYIDTILKEIERLNRAVDRLIEKKTGTEKTELKETLHRVVLLCNQAVKDKSVRTIEEYDEAVNIKGVNDSLFQAFYNIILNAYEAVEDGGEVIVRTKAFDRDAIIDVISSSMIDGRIIDRICDDGFTTKVKGHGIGLKIAKDAVEGAGGNISVESSDNKTKFSIRMQLQ